MQKKLAIQWFIEQNKDWEKILSEEPYCLSISRDQMFGKNLVMFKYSQIDSHFEIPLVKECRGIVLDEDTLEVVSHGYDKFFNFGEPNAAHVDEKTMRVSEKVDGSLMKLVNMGEGKLLISTNGVIDAFKADLTPQLGCPYKTFGDLFVGGLKKTLHGEDDFSLEHMAPLLDTIFTRGWTYMFELCSRWNRIVVPHQDLELYFHGARNNETNEEIWFQDCHLAKAFKTPRVYDISSFDKIIENTKILPWNDEGYVVSDARFNRVKVKSAAYLGVHHLRGNDGILSYRRAIDIMRANEIDEICSYFEEFKAPLLECKKRYHDMIEKINEGLDKLAKVKDTFATRKDAALWIQKELGKFASVGFMLLDSKISGAKDWLDNVPSDKVAKLLGYRD